MTHWMDTAKSEAEKATERLRTAQNLLRAAKEVYVKDPSRVNRISLKGCERLVKETESQLSEWEIK